MLVEAADDLSAKNASCAPADLLSGVVGGGVGKLVGVSAGDSADGLIGGPAVGLLAGAEGDGECGCGCNGFCGRARRAEGEREGASAGAIYGPENRGGAGLADDSVIGVIGPRI